MHVCDSKHVAHMAHLVSSMHPLPIPGCCAGAGAVPGRGVPAARHAAA